MQDLICNVCEACGVCGRSEDECSAYHEYYGLGEPPVGSKTSGGASVAVLERKTTRINESNQGVINRLSGRIVKVVEGELMANLTVKVGDSYISSIMPLNKFRQSGKRIGDSTTVVFKAVNVKMMK